MFQNHRYEVGDKAIVINEICGHQFEIGELVAISSMSGHSDHYQASNGKDSWYVSNKEILPYEIIKKIISEATKNV